MRAINQHGPQGTLNNMGIRLSSPIPEPALVRLTPAQDTVQFSGRNKTKPLIITFNDNEKEIRYPFTPVGTAEVYDRTAKVPVHVEIMKQDVIKHIDGKEIRGETYELKHQTEKIGSMTLEFNHLPDHVYMFSIDNHQRGRFHGVGSQLVQLAVERSQQLGAGGRLKLDTTEDSIGFHFGMGFRCDNAEYKDPANPAGPKLKVPGQILDSYLETRMAEARQAQQTAKISTRDKISLPDGQEVEIGNLTMSLPDTAIADWRQDFIQESPLLPDPPTLLQT